MNTKNHRNRGLSENEIDRLVVAQAGKASAWEKPIRVRKTKPIALSIPADLAARAAFLAGIHRTKDVGVWLTHVIQERIELEEAAFAGAKQDVTVQPSPMP